MKKRSEEEKYSEDEIKRYVGALSEEFQYRLSAIGESVVGLFDKVETLDQRLSKVEGAVRDIKGSVGIIEGDIEIFKSDLNGKVDYKEFADLKKKVLK